MHNTHRIHAQQCAGMRIRMRMSRMRVVNDDVIRSSHDTTNHSHKCYRHTGLPLSDVSAAIAEDEGACGPGLYGGLSRYAL